MWSYGEQIRLRGVARRVLELPAKLIRIEWVTPFLSEAGVGTEKP